MGNFRKFLLSAVVLLLSQPLSLFAINFESAKESCFEITKTVPLDVVWVMSTPKWYYPLQSRYDLYMTGMEISGKNAQDLREDELYYEYCPTFSPENGKFIAEAFGGIKKAYVIKPIKGMEVYEFYLEENPENVGKCYTTLTDNKTFLIAACCMRGEEMTWGVISTVKKLPEETVKEIYDHAESLGFKREYFTGLRYEKCGKKKSKGKNEL